MQFRTTLAAAAAVFAVSAGSASAAVTITVTPTLAPNAFGSPSYNAWVGNSVQGQLAGAATYGDQSLPTGYAAQSTVNARESIVTGFSSWKGVASPGGAFAGELGNRMLFGVLIDGGGEQFSISQLSFVMDSDDPGNLLDFSFGVGAYQYSNQYVGIRYGQDGMLGGLDDEYVTSGLNTQLVDGLVGRGSGSSAAAYCSPCTVAEQQAAINAAAAYFGGTGTVTHFTGTYTLGQATGSGTFNILGVPEPGTWALMIGGFGLAGAALRRRRVVAA